MKSPCKGTPRCGCRLASSRCPCCPEGHAVNKHFGLVYQLLLGLTTVIYFPLVMATTPLVDTLNREVEGGGFGHAMAAHGDELVIANDFAVNDVLRKGFVYRRVNGQWQWQQDLDLPGAGGTDLAGHQRIYLDDNMLVIATHWSDAGGSVYVFEKVNELWQLKQRIDAPDGPEQSQGFGGSIAVDGDTMVVGAPLAKVQDYYGPRNGKVHVFNRVADVWIHDAELVSTQGDTFHAYFGQEVAIGAGHIVVGERKRNRVQVFVGAGADWELEAVLYPADGEAMAGSFGRSLAFDGQRLIIGAPTAVTDDSNSGGAAYVFLREGQVWGQLQRLVSPQPPRRGFGNQIRLRGNTLLVGESDVNSPTERSGRAHVFTTGGMFFSPVETFSQTMGGGYAFSATATAITDYGFLTADTRPEGGKVYVYEPAMPELSISPSSLDFGTVPVNGSKLATATLSNTGNAVLQISSVSPALNPFSRQGGSCPNLLPIVIDVGASCTITWQYAPTQEGPQQTTIIFQTNDDQGEHSIVLEGQGIGPQLAISPAPVSFGTVILGFSSAPVAVTLSNAGGLPLTISSLPAPAAPFHLNSSTCPSTPFDLPPGDDCVVSYVYTPLVAGQATQAIEITSNSDSSPDQVVLFGYADGPDVQPSPNPMNFGSVKVGEFQDVQLQLFSSGVDTVTVSDLSAVTPPFAIVATTCETMPFMLLADTSCTITYRYTPTAAGPVSQAIVLSSNGPVPLQSIVLSGDGVQAALLASPAALNFGDRRLGETGSGTFSLSNVGSAAMTINAWQLPEAPFNLTGGSCGAPPFELDPSESCTINFQFAPAELGDYQDLLVLQSDTEGSPHSLTLGGTAADPELLFDPPVADFGAVLPGNSHDLSVMVYGSHDIKIILETIGSVSSPFELVGTTCVEEFSVAGNIDTCNLTLRFSPAAVGSFIDEMMLGSDAGNAPTALSLVGQGAGDPLFSDRFSVAVKSFKR
jgi:hypothetical protein